MINTASVIGIGALGGFVADSISNIEELETLIIIDRDIVEMGNLRNSIYRSIDVGLNKTDALVDMIKSKKPDLEIITIKDNYYEGKTVIPKSDFVFDCRDYTYDRQSEIDARLYMSSRYLIVDCRKRVSYQNKTHGRYLTELNREDLRSAGFIIYRLLTTNTMGTLMRNSTVQKYELDFIKKIDKPCDIVYEHSPKQNPFVNLPSQIVPILKANEDRDLTLYLGSKNFPFAQSEVPKLTLKTSEDIISQLTALTTINMQFNNYLVSLYKDYNEAFIEIIPETGAA
ncbi:MAG: ThiF family adenylyltransferase [Candidatus Heimdallarchaeaceae archaeon]